MLKLFIVGLLSLNFLVLQVFDASAIECKVSDSSMQVMFSYAPLVKKAAPAVVNIC